MDANPGFHGTGNARHCRTGSWWEMWKDGDGVHTCIYLDGPCDMYLADMGKLYDQRLLFQVLAGWLANLARVGFPSCGSCRSEGVVESCSATALLGRSLFC